MFAAISRLLLAFQLVGLLLLAPFAKVILWMYLKLKADPDIPVPVKWFYGAVGLFVVVGVGFVVAAVVLQQVVAAVRWLLGRMCVCLCLVWCWGKCVECVSVVWAGWWKWVMLLARPDSFIFSTVFCVQLFARRAAFGPLASLALLAYGLLLVWEKLSVPALEEKRCVRKAPVEDMCTRSIRSPVPFPDMTLWVEKTILEEKCRDLRSFFAKLRSEHSPDDTVDVKSLSPKVVYPTFEYDVVSSDGFLRRHLKVDLAVATRVCQKVRLKAITRKRLRTGYDARVGYRRKGEITEILVTVDGVAGVLHLYRKLATMRAKYLADLDEILSKITSPGAAARLGGVRRVWTFADTVERRDRRIARAWVDEGVWARAVSPAGKGSEDSVGLNEVDVVEGLNLALESSVLDLCDSHPEGQGTHDSTVLGPVKVSDNDGDDVERTDVSSVDNEDSALQRIEVTEDEAIANLDDCDRDDDHKSTKDDADRANDSSSGEGDVNDDAEDDDESDEGKPDGLMPMLIPRGLAEAEGLGVADRPTMSVTIGSSHGVGESGGLQGPIPSPRGLAEPEDRDRPTMVAESSDLETVPSGMMGSEELSTISTAPNVARVGPVGSSREVAPIQAQTEEDANELVAWESEFITTLTDAPGLTSSNMLMPDAEDVHQLAAMPSDPDVRTLANELGYVGMDGSQGEEDGKEEMETHPSKENSEIGNAMGHLGEASGQSAPVVTSPPHPPAHSLLEDEVDIGAETGNVLGHVRESSEQPALVVTALPHPLSHAVTPTASLEEEVKEVKETNNGAEIGNVLGHLGESSRQSALVAISPPHPPAHTVPPTPSHGIPPTSMHASANESAANVNSAFSLPVLPLQAQDEEIEMDDAPEIIEEMRGPGVSTRQSAFVFTLPQSAGTQLASVSPFSQPQSQTVIGTSLENREFGFSYPTARAQTNLEHQNAQESNDAMDSEDTGSPLVFTSRPSVFFGVPPPAEAVKSMSPPTSQPVFGSMVASRSGLAVTENREIAGNRRIARSRPSVFFGALPQAGGTDQTVVNPFSQPPPPSPQAARNDSQPTPQFSFGLTVPPSAVPPATPPRLQFDFGGISSAGAVDAMSQQPVAPVLPLPIVFNAPVTVQSDGAITKTPKKTPGKTLKKTPKPTQQPTPAPTCRFADYPAGVDEGGKAMFAGPYTDPEDADSEDELDGEVEGEGDAEPKSDAKAEAGKNNKAKVDTKSKVDMEALLDEWAEGDSEPKVDKEVTKKARKGSDGSSNDCLFATPEDTKRAFEAAVRPLQGASSELSPPQRNPLQARSEEQRQVRSEGARVLEVVAEAMEEDDDGLYSLPPPVRAAQSALGSTSMPPPPTPAPVPEDVDETMDDDDDLYSLPSVRTAQPAMGSTSMPPPPRPVTTSLPSAVQPTNTAAVFEAQPRVLGPQAQLPPQWPLLEECELRRLDAMRLAERTPLPAPPRIQKVFMQLAATSGFNLKGTSQQSKLKPAKPPPQRRRAAGIAGRKRGIDEVDSTCFAPTKLWRGAKGVEDMGKAEVEKSTEAESNAEVGTQPTGQPAAAAGRSEGGEGGRDEWEEDTVDEWEEDTVDYGEEDEWDD